MTHTDRKYYVTVIIIKFRSLVNTSCTHLFLYCVTVTFRQSLHLFMYTLLKIKIRKNMYIFFKYLFLNI